MSLSVWNSTKSYLEAQIFTNFEQNFCTFEELEHFNPKSRPIKNYGFQITFIYETFDCK